MLTALLASVLLGLVVYRVTRFAILDSLIEAPRDRVHAWLLTRDKAGWRKLQELLACPFCLTIWIAAGAVAITDGFTSVPLPVWVWLGSATVALLVWAQIDTE